MRFGKITVGLCALMCLASLAGCKTQSEVPPLGEGASVTYSSAITESSGAESSASGGTTTNSASGSTNTSSSSSKPVESSTAHVHNYTVKETVEPSCFRNGSKLFACECGDEYSEEIDAPGHSYTIETTIAPDCVNQGYTRHSCDVCGKSYDDTYTSPLDHTFGEWKTVKEATTSSDGLMQASCSTCGYTMSQVIPMLAEPDTFDDYCSEVVRLVNIERANYGLSPLSESSKLGDFAQVRSEEIERNFSHTRPNGNRAVTDILALGGLRTCGENIAMGQRTPEEVVDAWMNSEGHRANILKEDFTMIGVGCSFGGGVCCWVQVFGG